MLSSLQEASRNVDCVCLARSNQVPALYQVPDSAAIEFRTEFNTGNKALFGCGMARLREFADFCMRPELEGHATVIAGGHSLWFRNFFQAYMPWESQHVAKVSKMVNCGAVGFTLSQAEVEGKVFFYIDPKSVTPLFGPTSDTNPAGSAFESTISAFEKGKWE